MLQSLFPVGKVFGSLLLYHLPKLTWATWFLSKLTEERKVGKWI